MTIHVAPPVIAPPPSPVPEAPPAPSPRARGCSQQRPVVAAATALALAGAALITAVTLPNPVPAANTEIVVPAGPPVYTAEQISAAKQQACAAWANASTAMAQASNAVADAPNDWNNINAQRAIANEARTTLAETAYLKSMVGPATPEETAGPIRDYLQAALDQESATLWRKASQADAAIDRENAAVDKVNATCGLR